MGALEASPDLFLARRAAAGRADAWDEIIEKCGRRLYNMAFQFSGRREDAEDLTQEIFMRLHKNLKSYRGEVPFMGWALRLSRNACIDNYRKMRQERGWRQVADAVLEQLPAPGDLEAESLRRQRVDEVYAALAELSEEFSEAVLLCDLQGWSLEEASAFLEIPMGTLKSRLFRARNRLAERVQERARARRTKGSTVADASEGALP
jgi:RNA polymerase sigma-70 factor, ECF subfamily